MTPVQPAGCLQQWKRQQEAAHCFQPAEAEAAGLPVPAGAWSSTGLGFAGPAHAALVVSVWQPRSEQRGGSCQKATKQCCPRISRDTLFSTVCKGLEDLIFPNCFNQL